MNLFSSSKASNQHILIVDDNLDNLILLQCILEDSGYQTSIANCGKAALAMVESHSPNLIILDLMMPDMNGMEVAYHIRSNLYTQDIAIVLVTACINNIRDKDYKLVNKILAKPFDTNELLSLLQFFQFFLRQANNATKYIVEI